MHKTQKYAYTDSFKPSPKALAMWHTSFRETSINYDARTSFFSMLNIHAATKTSGVQAYISLYVTRIAFYPNKPTCTGK